MEFDVLDGGLASHEDFIEAVSISGSVNRRAMKAGLMSTWGWVSTLRKYLDGVPLLLRAFVC